MKNSKVVCILFIVFFMMSSTSQAISNIDYDTKDEYDSVLQKTTLKFNKDGGYDPFQFDIFDFLFDLIAKRMLKWPDYPGRYEFFDGELLGDFDSYMKGITSADFDNDGDLDFAVSHCTGGYSSKITIFYNEGDGSSFIENDVFTHYPPDEKSSRIISDLDSADYNNDGKTDLFFTYCEVWGLVKVNSTGYILLNDGNNGFYQKKLVFWHGMNETDPNPINPKVASADFDDDDDVDIIIGDNSGSLWFYKNNGDGEFYLYNRFEPGGEISWGIAAADFDNDGLIDIAYSNTDEELEYNIHIRYNDGTSSCFAEDDIKITDSSFFRISFWASPSPAGCCLSPIDYNNDNKMDLLCGQGDYYSLLIQQSDGGFEPFTAGRLPGRINYDEPGAWYREDIRNGGIAAGDFDNDGVDDALVGANIAGDVYLLHNRFMLVDVISPLDVGGIINDGIYDNGLGSLIGVMCYHPLSKGTTFVFGDLPVTVKPLQQLSKVEYYRDGRLMHTDYEEPFMWLYHKWSFGYHLIEVKGYDIAGNPGGTDECYIWKFG